MTGASASPSGSHPSGHAASGVDGASRFDPSREAELLAENARLRRALSPARAHHEIERIKKLAGREPEVLYYLDELEALVRYHETRADSWRGIAAAMGYEPNAHSNVKPTSPWLLARIAKYRAAIAMEAREGPDRETGLDGEAATARACKASPDV